MMVDLPAPVGPAIPSVSPGGDSEADARGAPARRGRGVAEVDAVEGDLALGARRAARGLAGPGWPAAVSRRPKVRRARGLGPLVSRRPWCRGG